MKLIMESVKARKKVERDFGSHYSDLCTFQNIAPQKCVTQFLSHGVLDVNVDRLTTQDWKPLLSALKENRSLRFIAFRSSYSGARRVNMPAIRQKYVQNLLSQTLFTVLRYSERLTCLELINIPLQQTDFGLVIQGIQANKSLEHLSFEKCLIGNVAAKALCKALKNCRNISTINLSSCNLSWMGVQELIDVLKQQALLRHTELWQESLRSEHAQLDKMAGLRRITLNNNTNFGNKGAYMLAEALRDDLWLKAVDIQNCAVDDSGVKSLLAALGSNSVIQIVDVRNNPISDRSILVRLLQKLGLNTMADHSQYKWLRVEPESTSKELADAKLRTRPPTGKKPGSLRGKCNALAVTPVKGIPWRADARVKNRGQFPHTIPGVPNFIAMSEDMCEGGDMRVCNRKMTAPHPHYKQEVISEDGDHPLTTTLKAERRQETRGYTNKEVKDGLGGLGADLRDLGDDRSQESIQVQTDDFIQQLDDEALQLIESTFTKFHAFLDLLKDVGVPVERQTSNISLPSQAEVTVRKRAGSDVAINDDDLITRLQKSQTELTEHENKPTSQERAISREANANFTAGNYVSNRETIANVTRVTDDQDFKAGDMSYSRNKNVFTSRPDEQKFGIPKHDQRLCHHFAVFTKPLTDQINSHKTETDPIATLTETVKQKLNILQQNMFGDISEGNLRHSKTLLPFRDRGELENQLASQDHPTHNIVEHHGSVDDRISQLFERQFRFINNIENQTQFTRKELQQNEGDNLNGTNINARMGHSLKESTTMDKETLLANMTYIANATENKRERLIAASKKWGNNLSQNAGDRNPFEMRSNPNSISEQEKSRLANSHLYGDGVANSRVYADGVSSIRNGAAIGLSTIDEESRAAFSGYEGAMGVHVRSRVWVPLASSTYVNLSAQNNVERMGASLY